MDKVNKTYSLVLNLIKKIGLPVKIDGVWDNEVIYYVVRNKENTKFILSSTKKRYISIVRQPLLTKLFRKQIFLKGRLKEKPLFAEYRGNDIAKIEGLVNAYKFILHRLK